MFETTKTIYSNSESSEQFLKQNTFLKPQNTLEIIGMYKLTGTSYFHKEFKNK